MKKTASRDTTTLIQTHTKRESIKKNRMYMVATQSRAIHVRIIFLIGITRIFVLHKQNMEKNTCM